MDLLILAATKSPVTFTSGIFVFMQTTRRRGTVVKSQWKILPARFRTCLFTAGKCGSQDQ